MEYDGNRVLEVRRRAALHVWLGWLVALLSMDAGYEEKSTLLQSGGM